MLIKYAVRLVRAFKNSWAGLVEATREEHAFQTEILVAVFMMPIGLYFAKNTVEFCVLFGAGMLIFVAELINSSIEAAVDRVGSEYHPLAGKAKDLGSAAVFLAIINAAIIWALILVF